MPRRARFASTRLLGAISMLLGLAAGAAAMPAPDATSVLILADTVSGGLGSNEATRAVFLGYTPVVVSGATWSTMTTAEFATYRALVLGDRTCSSVGTGDIAAAEANRATWTAALTGNIVINGTDPVFHSGQGGLQMTESSIAFAANIANKTGLYVSLACYYHGTAPSTPVNVLDQLGTFTVTGVGCYDNAHIVAVHPALAGMTDASLSNWSCSVHEAFDSFPPSFSPLVIANGISTGAISFPDGSFGPPYVLARGATVIGCGNGALEVGEQCDDGNNTAGDGCGPTCFLEECGNGITDPGEQCDDNNVTSGDGCSSTCQNELCGDGALQPILGEQCDDGNTTPGDGCSATCKLEVCGNGFVDPGEQCDDGNTTPGDGCDASCQLEGGNVCGDGAVAPPEECDDGNTTPGDGCSATCEIEEDCSNLADDDGNGLIDCADPDCTCDGVVRARPHLRGADLRFRPGQDRLQIHLQVSPNSPIAPDGELFGVLLTNGNGTIVNESLPGGSLTTPNGKRFQYRNPAARTAGGISRVQILQRPNGSYRVDVDVYGDFSPATLPNMTLQVTIGDDSFVNVSAWLQKVNGWNMVVP